MRLTPGEEKRVFLEDKGIFFLDDPINSVTAYVTSINLFHFDLKDGREYPNPIWIILNSPGGLVSYGLAIYDSIRAVVERGRPVNILGVGEVASMAATIMQAGSKRYTFPHTKFLLHELKSDEIFEDVAKAKEKFKEIDKMNDLLMGIVATRCGMDKDELKKLCEKTDYCLDSKEARQFGTNGLVDEIVTKLPF